MPVRKDEVHVAHVADFLVLFQCLHLTAGFSTRHKRDMKQRVGRPKIHILDDALHGIVEALEGAKGKALILSKKETRELIRSDVKSSVAAFWDAHTWQGRSIVPTWWLRTREGRRAIEDEVRKLGRRVGSIEAALRTPKSLLGPHLKHWQPWLDKMKRAP